MPSAGPNSREKVISIPTTNQSGIPIKMQLRYLMVRARGTDAGLLPDSNSVEFTVRPNPASNVAALTVQLKGQIDCDDIQYELYDTAGQRLLVGRSDICEFPVPIESFSSGTYVMRFRFHGIFYDVPVVIQR